MVNLTTIARSEYLNKYLYCTFVPTDRRSIMKRKTKKRILIWGGVLSLPIVMVVIMRLMSIVSPPVIADRTCTADTVVYHEGYRQLSNNFLRQNDSGLWEMYLEGSPFERGVAYGKLTEDLLYYQEKVFVDQIRELVPSDTYMGVLKHFIVFFNRNLTKDVPQEYLEEIYGVSLSCTDEYNFIGSPYQRQLNYHGAHDIGHALQDLMLVGCTSFAVWGSQSADSSLLVGRNFDFHMGDAFAKNKLISFYNPTEGYRFASVGWAGMVGVLSGMNETGLTVTINAAKSAIPLSSATPISILTRKILQYASTIDEAYAIARQYDTFVSEAILIASAHDGKAAIIEKSPKQIDIYYSDNERVVCSNHFQSKTFGNDKRNVENIATSDSKYRFDRMQELLNEHNPITPALAVGILRDRDGLGGKPVGYGNEMAINQMIAHHAVVFEPSKRLMYVSTDPWQSGKFIVYDLTKVFANPDFSRELREEREVAADAFLTTKAYADFLAFRQGTKELAKAIDGKTPLADSTLTTLISLNPNYYYAYERVGDYYLELGDTDKAAIFWRMAETREIPKLAIREAIRAKIVKYEHATK